MRPSNARSLRRGPGIRRVQNEKTRLRKPGFEMARPEGLIRASRSRCAPSALVEPIFHWMSEVRTFLRQTEQRKKAHLPMSLFSLYGAPGRIRTSDRLVRRAKKSSHLIVFINYLARRPVAFLRTMHNESQPSSAKVRQDSGKALSWRMLRSPLPPAGLPLRTRRAFRPGRKAQTKFGPDSGGSKASSPPASI